MSYSLLKFGFDSIIVNLLILELLKKPLKEYLQQYIQV